MRSSGPAQPRVPRGVKLGADDPITVRALDHYCSSVTQAVKLEEVILITQVKQLCLQHLRNWPARMTTTLLILNIPIILLAIALSRLYRLRRENNLKKDTLLQELGVSDGGHKRIVGFFHPYWYVIRLRYNPRTRVSRD